MIKRYKGIDLWERGAFISAPDGDICRYDDHLEEIAKRDAIIEKQREIIEEMREEARPNELLQRVYAETENGWHVKPLTRHDIKAWLDCIDAIDMSLEYVAGSTK